MHRLLLIHGFGCDSRHWREQAGALEGHEVCAPDLPYHGGPAAGVSKSLEGLAEWLVETHLSEPATLVGHSLGGMIALRIVRDHPDLVRGVALVDSFASLELNSAYLPGMFPERMEAAVRERIESSRAGIIGNMSQATYDAIWPSVAAFDARPWLSGIRCPLLGIYGGRGRYGGGAAEQLKHDLRLHEVSGPVTLKVIPQAGHFVQLEYPREVNAALVQWLTEHRL
jgi:pyruvate dehydrogenase E2 component (dihydrolipoamide acetyltransferase)